MNVAVRYVGICGSDIIRLGMGQDMLSLGHEIVAQGEDGTYYAVNPLLPCLQCAYCQDGKTRFCQSLHSFGKDLKGGFSGGVLDIPDSNLIPVRKNKPLPYVLTDSLACVVNGLNLLTEEAARVLVIGDGTMATLFMHELMARGVNTVQVVKDASRTKRAAFGRKVMTFDMFEGGAYDNAFDAIIIAVGGQSAHLVNVAAHTIKPSGLLLVAGAYHSFIDELDIKTILTKEIRLTGVYSYEPANFIEAVHVIDNDEQFFTAMVTDIYRSSDMSGALDCHSTKDNRMKVVVEMV